MTHVGFLRAVNVGRRRVQMARLAEIVGSLGYADVWTHINSGNVVFDGSGERSALEHRIETALEDEFGFEVTTFVRTVPELRRVLALEPFSLAARDTYFVTFLKTRPPAEEVAALKALGTDFDTLAVDGREVHWRMRGKSSDTKLTSKAWADIVGKDRSTSRNVNMLRKLIAKIDAPR